jgi:hypothetical protein
MITHGNEIDFVMKDFNFFRSDIETLERHLELFKSLINLGIRVSIIDVEFIMKDQEIIYFIKNEIIRIERIEKIKSLDIFKQNQ